MVIERSAKALLFDKAVATLGLSTASNYRVLDFGCGSGELLNLLATSVSANSHLVGYDAMEQSIARARAASPNIEFLCARFEDRLPFADASFDVIVTIDTIECIKNKRALIDEFHRVLKPDGRILAMHWDWDTQTYNIPSRELARRAVWAFSDWKQPWMDEADGQMGRKLWGLFEGSKKFRGSLDTFCLIETQYEAGKYGYDRAHDLAALVEHGGFDRREYERFRRELSESRANGEYLYSVTSFVYHGGRRHG